MIFLSIIAALSQMISELFIRFGKKQNLELDSEKDHHLKRKLSDLGHDDEEEATNRPLKKIETSAQEKIEDSGDEEELFGKCLVDFGYAFDENGEMKDVKTGEKFVFEKKPNNRDYNQCRYEALGQVIDEEIYGLLENDCNLKRIYIPIDATDDEPKGFFFATENAWNCEKMMILIHGSGVVRAGQWARRLIINENLNCGTQIPYIKRAVLNGYGVVVLNTNQNRAYSAKSGLFGMIRGSSDPEAHALYVWDNFIAKSGAQFVAFVAHSAGGYVTMRLAVDRPADFSEYVFAVAFTDSVHSTATYSPVWSHMKKICCNWVCSTSHLDTPLRQYYGDVLSVSAGSTIHEMTSHTAFNSIFKFFDKKFEEVKLKIEDAEEIREDFAKNGSEMEKEEICTNGHVHENGTKEQNLEKSSISDSSENEEICTDGHIIIANSLVEQNLETSTTSDRSVLNENHDSLNNSFKNDIGDKPSFIDQSGDKNLCEKQNDDGLELVIGSLI